MNCRTIGIAALLTLGDVMSLKSFYSVLQSFSVGTSINRLLRLCGGRCLRSGRLTAGRKAQSDNRISLGANATDIASPQHI